MSANFKTYSEELAEIKAAVFCNYCGEHLIIRYNLGKEWKSCPKHESFWHWFVKGDWGKHYNEIVGDQPDFYDPKTGEPK